MKFINAAIVGCGAIHQRHVQAIQANTKVRLVAVVDKDKGKVDALALKYNCQSYVDYIAMLGDDKIDVVHICTPHDTHKKVIIDSLLSGKHVFTEKPVALNLLEVKDIKNVLSNTDKLLGVCLQNRFNKTSVKIKSILDEGILGNIKGIKAILTWSRGRDYYSKSSWRGRFNSEGGSLLINQAIHTLDLMQWFCGGVSRLKGVVDSTFLSSYTEAEDSAMVSFEFKNGAKGIFYGTNCATRDSPLLIEIYCEKGILKLHDNQLFLETTNDNICIESDEIDALESNNYWEHSHSLLINSFYNAIDCKGEFNFIDVMDAEKSLAVVEAIYNSSRMRCWIKLS